MNLFVLPLFCLLLVNVVLAHNKISRVRLESCPGCSLNRLHEVKQFFYEDVPKYENVEWKRIGGAPPEAIFLDENDEEVERHMLKDKSREECNTLLTSRGFIMNEDKEL
ncbi:unnamed protein product [Brassicogethes aeneus]|uniref:Selenoprotein M n=1 Tax=Brassicogethes aeneus TaxID=1431903 RepID=A0A9P0B4I3_BRAAE|nr:unnamed protein product [Brassicogethes aeneus]